MAVVDGTVCVLAVVDKRCTTQFSKVPHFGSLRHAPPKSDSEKKQNCSSYRMSMEKSHGLGTRREARKTNGRHSDDFGIRGPVIQKTFQTKTATSSVARFIYACLTDTQRPLCSFGVRGVYHIPRKLTVRLNLLGLDSKPLNVVRPPTFCAHVVDGIANCFFRLIATHYAPTCRRLGIPHLTFFVRYRTWFPIGSRPVGPLTASQAVPSNERTEYSSMKNVTS